jgi:tetratricopeptide (TPR) repeat protein
VIVLVLGGWFWYSRYQARGAPAYAEAMMHAMTSQSPRAPAGARAQAIREIEAALAEYPSNPVAGQAAYELGNLRYLERDFAGARGAFEVALAKGAKGTVATLSRAGIAYTWESERDFAKATAAFQGALAGLGAQDFLYDELLLGLARNQELSGQKEAAIATYRRMLKELPRSRGNDIARSRLVELGASPTS